MPTFESILEKIDTTSPNPNQSYTKPYQKHTPYGFCYIKSSVGDQHNKLEMYREDTPQEFVKWLEKYYIQLTEVMQKTYKPMKLT